MRIRMSFFVSCVFVVQPSLFGSIFFFVQLKCLGKFVCPHGCHGGKPYCGSYTRLRRHLCGVLDSDEKKGFCGGTNLPKHFN